MYSIKYDWKTFNVSLPAIEAWFKANAGEFYTGNSADVALTLWFTEEPDQATKDSVEAYWAGLTEESSEVTSYVSRQAILDACAALRSGLVAKTWDQMSVAERKLVLGQTPTSAELGL